ncbi:MAG TPA: hypothetical protein PLA83_04085 [Deltaproteobacteria bacterium]|mgnify:FL=1|jgi:hypothetical protein|nr:hypothetical protein [Deltaproteobacteria bacterium]HQI00425.1 hypothetical protein [Deltaproteobacteria bacterium]HQJ07517.1 hypothetical protein [Deltaproteobacteria bacterium]
MKKDNEDKARVYYFKCEGCQSDIFWTDIRPSVERASRVFKWVRAGCPNEDCSRYLILSAPDEVLDSQEAKRIYEDKKNEGKEKVYWI